jgi:hypothetical protein
MSLDRRAFVRALVPGAALLGLASRARGQGGDGAMGASRVLAGIPPIDWSTTTSVCFPGSLLVSANYLGEDLSAVEAMGITGAAFKLFWWAPGRAPWLCDLMVHGEEPVRRAFAALGRDYRYAADPLGTSPERPHDDWRAMIVAEIDAGRPVIAEGLVGPPECSVVAGYEDGGRVLRGMSYFQEDKRDYFRVEGWGTGCAGVITFGEKGPVPERAEALADCLEFALTLGREGSFENAGLAANGEDPKTWSGLRAYECLADSFLEDAWWDGDLENMQMSFYASLNDGLLLLSDKRRYAGLVTDLWAGYGLPGAEELAKAAKAFGEEATHLQALIADERLPYSESPEEDRLRMVDRGLRERVAAGVRLGRDLDIRALDHLGSAREELLARA